MKWKDFFYFSKGERQALTVLLSLIAIVWLTIFYSSFIRPKRPIDTITKEIKKDTIRYFPIKKAQVPDQTQTKSHIIKQRTAPFKRHERIHTTRKNEHSPYQKKEKYPEGTVLEINGADTTALKKIPGIGSVFAKRIVKYRNLLGGFYSIEQLAEVYGIDEDKYNTLHKWFTVDPSLIDSLQINKLPAKQLASHPYVSYKQAKIIEKIIRKNGRINGWDDLILLEEFPEFEQKRLQNYLSFQ